jgi:hypothetical protein
MTEAEFSPSKFVGLSFGPPNGHAHLDFLKLDGPRLRVTIPANELLLILNEMLSKFPPALLLAADVSKKGRS